MDQVLNQEPDKPEGAPAPDVPPTVPEEPAEQVDHASEASKFGWRDKDEFVAKGGRESDWMPPDQFLVKREQLANARARENKKLERALEARDRELDTMRHRVEAMEKMLAEREQARGEVQESVLWDQRQQALENQDWANVNRIDREISKLNRTPAPRQPTPSGPDPRVVAILEEFADDHSEYRRPEMQRYLSIAAKTVAEADPSLKGRALLDEAHDYARRQWSDKYVTTSTRRAPPMAETGGSPGRANGAGERGWSDLKTDARQALDQFIKESPVHAKMKLDEARARILKNVPDEQFKR